MERLTTPEEVRQWLAPIRRDGATLGLVPTMGALHDGHLSLVRAAHERAERVAVSIFVNPTQFGPGEDYEAYPRDLDHDLDMLQAEGVDLVFTPSAGAMYPPGSTTVVEPGPLGDVLEGASRPGHFRGVCTVVAKLLNIVGPDVAFFGEKDFQQLVIVTHMARDLDVPAHIVACEIVREADGLAMSSRNVYLSAEERRAATVLSRALQRAAELAGGGQTDARALRETIEEMLSAEPLVTLDYAAIVDPVTLAAQRTLLGEARALVAARVGTTRLIDNIALQPPRE